MLDWPQTIISQYANSPVMRALMDYMNQWLDPTADLDAFYDLVWNVDTAQGWGLDVWGRIVGVARTLSVTGGVYWGHAEAGTLSAWPYGQGAFYSGEHPTANYRLSDSAYRTLILAKAAANITDDSIPAFNAILFALFPGRGDVWVADNLDMSMTLTFAFAPALTPVELAIIQQSGALPRPTGVLMNIIELPSQDCFIVGVGGDLLTGTGGIILTGYCVHPTGDYPLLGVGGDEVTDPAADILTSIYPP